METNQDQSDKQLDSKQNQQSEETGFLESLSFLADDENLKPEKEEKKETKSGDKEEETEEIKLETEEKPVEDDDLEEVITLRRKDILTKYPDLFKTFPDLERAFFREQKFTEIFPTLKDAQEASERIKNFSTFETDLLAGNPASLLTEVKNSDENAFVGLAEQFLPTLAKVDQNVYHSILGNIFKSAVVSMMQEAQSSKSEKLYETALTLNQYLFGTAKIEAPQTLRKEQKSPEADKLNEERAAFIKEKFEAAHSDVTERATNLLRSTVERYIDPKEVLSSYAKSKAIEDVINQIDNEMAEDSRFRASFDKLWESAFEHNFNDFARRKLKDAWLNRAKQAIPTIIRKVRSEAMKDVRRKETEEPKPKQLSVSRPSTTSSKQTTNPKELPRSMKTLDFLNSD
jgi:hypothetical protein